VDIGISEQKLTLLTSSSRLNYLVPSRLLMNPARLLPVAALVKVSPHDLPTDGLTPPSLSASSVFAGCYPLGRRYPGLAYLSLLYLTWRSALLPIESSLDLRGFLVLFPDEVLVLWFEPWIGAAQTQHT
jgi:hypothetical protein